MPACTDGILFAEDFSVSWGGCKITPAVLCGREHCRLNGNSSWSLLLFCALACQPSITHHDCILLFGPTGGRRQSLPKKQISSFLCDRPTSLQVPECFCTAPQDTASAPSAAPWSATADLNVSDVLRSRLTPRASSVLPLHRRTTVLHFRKEKKHCRVRSWLFFIVCTMESRTLHPHGHPLVHTSKK